jgi:hypothetical protein
MASVAEHSEIDRIASKKALKTLQDVGNVPSTTTARRYRYELFM